MKEVFALLGLIVLSSTGAYGSFCDRGSVQVYGHRESDQVMIKLTTRPSIAPPYTKVWVTLTRGAIKDISTWGGYGTLETPTRIRLEVSDAGHYDLGVLATRADREEVHVQTVEIQVPGQKIQRCGYIERVDYLP